MASVGLQPAHQLHRQHCLASTGLTTLAASSCPAVAYWDHAHMLREEQVCHMSIPSTSNISCSRHQISAAAAATKQQVSSSSSSSSNSRQGFWGVAMDLQPGPNGPPILLNPDRVLPLLRCCHPCTEVPPVGLDVSVKRGLLHAACVHSRANRFWLQQDADCYAMLCRVMTLVCHFTCVMQLDMFHNVKARKEKKSLRR